MIQGRFREVVVDWTPIVRHTPTIYAKIDHVTIIGIARLWVVPDGLRFSVPNIKESNLTRAIRRGEMGCSFGLSEIIDDWVLYDGDIPTRTIRDTVLTDVTVTDRPAYKSTRCWVK